jgi:hypothetical protein
LLQGCAKKIEFDLLSANRPFKFSYAIRRLCRENQLARPRRPSAALQCRFTTGMKLTFPSV